MKKLLIIIFCSGLLLACNQQSKDNKAGQDSSATNMASDDEISSSDSIYYETRSFYRALPDCPKDSCPVYVQAEYPYFKDQRLRKFILNLITPTPYNNKIAASLEIAADSFINEYQNFHKEFPESPAAYEWQQTIITHQDVKNLISFEHNTYSYTGGAHGMYSTLYYNLQKKNLKRLKLSDILVKNYESELTKIAEAIFRKENNLSKEDDLRNDYFFENDKFHLNDNFLLTSEGIRFLYNPYEIAAYARGQVELLIPYLAIKKLIRKDGPINQ